MSNEQFLFWGFIVSLFLFFSAILTARQLFENYLEGRQRRNANAGTES